MKQKKVIIALSGGVDSAVAAALLKRANFEVRGVFLKLADLPGLREAEARARKVAKILKIPFYVFNFEKEFKKRIVDYFLKENKKGLTPNPCVVCNKEIKFGLLLEKALTVDADYLATGHYARKKQLTTDNLQLTTYKLLRARDKNKDQSYFLWMLNQEQLKRILFPIGDYTREEVENLARKFKLPVLKARKSVEICFIKTTINDFLKKYLGERPDKLICLTPGVKHVKEGKVIGEYRGLWFYTIGQRKGIGLPGGPYWVLDKDLKKNRLIVTKNERDLHKKELFAKNINWISDRKPKLPLKVKVKIRYRHQPASATIYKLSTTHYKLTFDRPQRAITPGQSVVFYKGEELLGGGIIC